MTLIERVAAAVLARIATHGSLSITWASGSTTVIGSGAPHADIALRDPGAGLAIVRGGLTGFADAYMDGDVETTDLRALLLWGAANHDAWFATTIAKAGGRVRRAWLEVRPERRHPRVRSMTDHYNLGNEFYEAWLDPTMTYSSARFEQPDQSLSDAQLHKYRTIASQAGLEPGMHVLEIGCGWGGFARFAAETLGCTVVGVTISDEQARYARKIMANAGITDKVDIRLEDFRETTGTFDAVVSIEMIESIDESQWPDLFTTISNRLRAGGRAAMQIITIGDELWDRYRTSPDFIQEYIFPGGQLPAPKVLNSLAAGSGLSVEQVETFGLDYARTLQHWQDRFGAAWPKLSDSNGLDARFKRMWDLYLTVCEAGFRSGRVDVQQWLFAKAH
ncbi:MAG: class I SAM-dependent methyltransferase [Acidimicrobiia bacterium]|nr:class I SAM-dependent methyltransferase [Acidimicrobiia bacterium]